MCPGYHPTCIQAATLCVYPGCRSMRMQAAAMQGVTDQRQAMALNEAIGDAEQVAGYPP